MHLICISLITHEVEYLFCVLIGHLGIFFVSLLIEPETHGPIVLLGGSHVLRIGKCFPWK